MTEISKKAYAKINLTLEILGLRRADGFHDIASVMHKVASLYDEVTVRVSSDETVTLLCDTDVCPPEKNLAYRAAVLYADRAKKAGRTLPGTVITLNKHIPSGAGLAGGSADAAAVLRAYDELFGVLSEEELFAAALSLGSDIPFCLATSECALCTGRGECMEPLPPIEAQIEVRFPETPLSTAGIYAEYDRFYGEDYTKDKSFRMVEALRSGAPLAVLAAYMCNDFQALCEARCPEIAVLCKRLTDEGYAAQMSGSGSAVFGLREKM